MAVQQAQNVREWKLRAKHHAKPLFPLAEMAADFFTSAKGARAFKRGVRVYTRKGSYVIRPWSVRGEGYVGIEVKRFGEHESIRLRVE